GSGFLGRSSKLTYVRTDNTPTDRQVKEPVVSFPTRSSSGPTTQPPKGNTRDAVQEASRQLGRGSPPRSALRRRGPRRCRQPSPRTHRPRHRIPPDVRQAREAHRTPHRAARPHARLPPTPRARPRPRSVGT